MIRIKTKDSNTIKKDLMFKNLNFKSFQLLNNAKGVKKIVRIINKCCKGVKKFNAEFVYIEFVYINILSQLYVYVLKLYILKNCKIW